MDDGPVAETEVLQLPEEAGGDVAACAEVAEECVLPAAKAAPGVTDGQAGDKGTKLRLLQPVRASPGPVPARWPARDGTAGPGRPGRRAGLRPGSGG